MDTGWTLDGPLMVRVWAHHVHCMKQAVLWFILNWTQRQNATQTQTQYTKQRRWSKRVWEAGGQVWMGNRIWWRPRRADQESRRAYYCKKEVKVQSCLADWEPVTTVRPYKLHLNGSWVQGVNGGADEETETGAPLQGDHTPRKQRRKQNTDRTARSRPQRDLSPETDVKRG